MISLVLMSVLSAAAPFAHIRTPVYDPDEVVTIEGCLGFQTMVHVLPGERIEVIAIGNSFDWQVTPNQRGQLMSVKATTTSGISNLTVVTDANRYHFVLVPATGADCATGDVVHELRFRRP